MTAQPKPSVLLTQALLDGQEVTYVYYYVLPKRQLWSSLQVPTFLTVSQINQFISSVIIKSFLALNVLDLPGL